MRSFFLSALIFLALVVRGCRGLIYGAGSGQGVSVARSSCGVGSARRPRVRINRSLPAVEQR